MRSHFSISAWILVWVETISVNAKFIIFIIIIERQMNFIFQVCPKTQLSNPTGSIIFNFANFVYFIIIIIKMSEEDISMIQDYQRFAKFHL